MIPDDIITAWGANIPWRSRTQIEQDLILHGIIQAMYSNEELSEKLAFRGGTCLNKLYWKVPWRYSEDLDFVQIVPQPIGPTIKLLRNVLKEFFSGEPLWENKKRGFRLFYKYPVQEGPNKVQQVKIEINTREHFAFEGYKKKVISLDSAWRSGKANVTTFSLEELLATKLRALYQRRKGRDLFDLWMSQEEKPDYEKVVSIYLKYMAHEEKKADRDGLMANLQQKLEDPVFLQDMSPLIRAGIKYDIPTASQFVMERLYSLVPLSRSKQKKKVKK